MHVNLRCKQTFTPETRVKHRKYIISKENNQLMVKYMRLR